MTTNQINFQKLQEDRRHNQAVESENLRHNTATETQGIMSIAETGRHNKEQELINWYSYSNLPELRAAQSDLATSQASNVSRSQGETERSHHAQEDIAMRGQEVTMRGQNLGFASGVISDITSIFRVGKR